MISFRNVSCFLCFPVKNDKCFLAYTTYLVWFAANKSKVLTDPKRNINPKNKSTLRWPIALKLLSTLDLVNFHNEQCKIILADEIFNKISKRAEPNFFHMLLSHKTGGRGRGASLLFVCPEEKRKTDTFQTHFMSGSLLQFCCSAVNQTMMLFFSSITWPLERRKRLDPHSSSSLCWLFLLPVKPLHPTTLPAANCQDPMDLSQRWYTHTAFST